MRKLLLRVMIATLILFLAIGHAAAFDFQIGHLNFGPPPADTAGYYQSDNSGFGASITIPLGFSASEQPSATLNGQDISRFTQQDAKDSLIVIMLFSVAIAAGVLSASAVAQ